MMHFKFSISSLLALLPFLLVVDSSTPLMAKQGTVEKTDRDPASNLNQNQLPDMRSLNRGMSHLLNIKGIQRELEMTEQQSMTLLGSEDGPSIAIREAFFAYKKEIDEEDTTEEARAKVVAYQDKVKEILENEKEKLNKILLPQQVERLAQIQLQMLGIHIWKVESVQEHVGVSEQQLKKINGIIRDDSLAIKKKANEAVRQKKREKEATMAEIETMREQIDVKINDLFTNEQKRKLDELIGEKFDPMAEEKAKKKAEGERKKLTKPASSKEPKKDK